MFKKWRWNTFYDLVLSVSYRCCRHVHCPTTLLSEGAALFTFSVLCNFISAGLSFDRQCAWGRRGRQKALVFGKKQARQPERERRGSMRIRSAWRVQIENQTKPPCGHMRLKLNASYPANWMSSRPATQGTHTKCASASMMERSPPGGKPSCLRS